MTSEELIQTSPSPIGRYRYYKLGSTTIKQLSEAKIISAPGIDLKLKSKKPDGLVVLAGGRVKAVIEYKTEQQLNTRKKREKAIGQEIDVAKALCKILIVSSGTKSIWINALNGEEICGSDNKPIKTKFNVKQITDGTLSRENLVELEGLIDKIDFSISEKRNVIQSPLALDPSALAKSIWQKIWIATGKEPEKCLYNVVELFIFKFLSDIGVLSGNDDFQKVIEVNTKNGSVDALEHYAAISRPKIKKLFPESSSDGTTIINGTIFINESDKANVAQASLFSEVLINLLEYDQKFGSFRHIDKNFKTRLYETFLRQSAGVKALGQHFTPRNVVQAMVSMSKAKNGSDYLRVCDPFCGVGGFLLELLIQYKEMFQQFEPKNGKIKPSVVVRGYDKGTDEKDDEITIILAKANMLIYFSDLRAQNSDHKFLREFSEKGLNTVFRLLRDNLGTFGIHDDEPYDLILTNPPYVQKGSKFLKTLIQENGYSDRFTFEGAGTEALAIEWIVRNLKPGGQAIVVIPDTLLQQARVFAGMKDMCFIRAIISLPQKTFYATPKKTSIIVLERKPEKEKSEEYRPVFLYWVSEIGETRDTNRLKFEENDLTKMVSLYNQYSASPDSFETTSPRCKFISFDELERSSKLFLEDFWTTGELQEFEGLETSNSANTDNYQMLIDSAITALGALKDSLVGLDKIDDDFANVVSTPLSKIFDFRKGKSEYTKRYISENPGQYPVYSSKTYNFGELGKINTFDLDGKYLTWTTDGAHAGTVFLRNGKFSMSSHCGAFIFREEVDDILIEFVFAKLDGELKKCAIGEENKRITKEMIERVEIKIPITKDGKFDLEAQRIIAEKHTEKKGFTDGAIQAVNKFAKTKLEIDV